MEKNRLFIIISSAVAIISTFLPWVSLNAGVLGSYSENGLRGTGLFIIIVAAIAIVLASLNDIKTSMQKEFAIGVIALGGISTLLVLIGYFGINKYLVNIAGYGVSLGFGLILALISSVAIIVAGLLAMSGGKITKGTFEELAESGKGFAQSSWSRDNFYCKNCCERNQKRNTRTHRRTSGSSTKRSKSI